MKRTVTLTLTIVDGPLRFAGYDRTVAGAMKGSPDVLHLGPGDCITLTLDDRHDVTLTLGDAPLLPD